ncbi:MAG TPA: ATP-binding protein [Capillimicrobium sp.]|nr:ATP-binding protein [Capillimicrobium sp.]
MRQLSIGRSFRLALVGLALVLAVLAGVGVAQLYDARRDLEEDLSSAYRLEAAAGRLLAAGIVEEATLRTATPAERADASREAREEYARAVVQARALAAADPRSARLVEQAIHAQDWLRPGGGHRGTVAARPVIERLVARQHERRDEAEHEAATDSRRALIVMGAFGLLAMVVALVVVRAILAALRRPLDELVDAAGRLAGGDLAVRVREDLPGELAALGRAFNAMAGDLGRAQDVVARERERLSDTVESLGDGLVVVEDGCVTSANGRASELLGPLPVGTPLAEIELLPDPLDALAGEVIVEHGRQVLSVRATRLGYGSRGLVWTVRDVSERVRLERLKSEFVATASHELRSPLTSIKGFVELLHKSPDLSDRQREWVEIVLVSANRLVDLVNDLLDVTRLEAGRLEVHRRPTDVGEAAREVARLLEPRIAARDQRLDLDVPEELPRAMADPARLRQVITNLLTNAHQYTGDGGRIELRADAVDGHVRIAVSDTGPGMGAEDLEHVFDRFYRGSGAAGATPGTGLGLAIVRSLVDLQGGSVAVDSQLGEGTTFTVELPRAPGVDEPGSAHVALSGRRVLVVEDEERTAAAIAAHLERYGVEAVRAASGDEAIARLRDEAFDAMTLDILMPGMSGFEVLRTVRGDARLRALPIVVVSAFAGREALSGEWVVAKPIDADELADALGAAVLAGRVRVLVVGRPELRDRVAFALDELGIEFEWASGVDDARRRAERGRFEVALLDAGLADPHAALDALELRGRRLRRSVIVFSVGADAPGLARLDAEPVPIEDAGAAVLAVLGEPERLPS